MQRCPGYKTRSISVADAPNRMFWGEQYEETVYGVLGTKVTLECLVAADPEIIAFNWTHTGLNGTSYFEPVVGHEAGFEQYVSVNEMEYLHKESYGNVTCTAFNAAGSGKSMVFYVLEHGR